MPTRIAGGTIRHLQAPSAAEIKTSFGIMRNRHAFVLILRSDGGLRGLGESWINFPVWSPWERVAAFEQAYLPYLKNKEVDDIGQFMAAMMRAFSGPATQAGTLGALSASLCAIEGALWDLRAQEMGLGVSDLWFDNPSPRIAIYASGINAPLPIPWIEQMLERGVKLFKLKLGFGRDEDLKNLREMKEILGNNAALAVDANRAWDFAYAKYWVKALAEYNVRWLEEPLRPAEEKHYPALHQISTIPLAAGENAWCLPGQEVHDFDRLDVDIWQPDLTKNCGPSQALQLIKHAQTKGRQVLPHYLGSAVGQAISLHMAAGCEEPLMEWDINPSKLRTDFFRGGFEIRDGCIQLPASPGLGWQWDDPEDDKVRG